MSIEGIINTPAEENADVVFISAPYEGSASFHKGTALGPEKMVSCLNRQIEFWDRNLKKETHAELKISHVAVEGLEGANPEHAVQAIKDVYVAHAEKTVFPMILGGEHSVSIAAFQAIAEREDAKEITIVQLDAHCDLRNDDSDYNELSPSHFAHSTIARRGHQLGFNLVQVGIRAYSTEEYEYFTEHNNITVFEWNTSKKPSIQEIIDSIKTTKVYLTIDVDGFDPAHMPGTGTPVQGGIEWWYGNELIETLFATKDVIAADIVEVMPQEDTGLTEYGAAQLAYNMVGFKFRDQIK